jgi:putative peptidoglycan binding protein
MARVYFRRAAQGFRAVRGEVVRRVQLALRAGGSDPGTIDAIYGGDTERGLKDFQSRHRFAATGTLTDETWSALMTESAPPIRDRCVQLTADFEGHGFEKVAGNFDGAGLTWGIIGFTLQHGEVQRILTEVHERHPALLGQAFGDLADELRRMLRLGRPAQIAWADGISIGTNKDRVEPPWERAFAALGSAPEVQAIQLRRVDPYWDLARRDVGRFGLSTEAGLALCFDIAVQNGGIDSEDEERRIRQALTDHPPAAERDVLVVIADVVAENSRPEFVENVRRRKRTIATADGTVNGARYATGDWGIDESPGQN